VAVAAKNARLRSISIEPSAWRALAASWVGWMFDGYEIYALVLVMAVAVRQLLPPEQLARASVYMGGLLASTLVGWAIGGVIAGVLTDYIGRKRMLVLSILWYALFAGMTALSPDYWWLLIFRFLTGLGLGAEWGPGTAIVAELWPASSRGRAGGILHSAQGVGFLLASGVWSLLSPLGVSSWRYMFLIGILPAFSLLFVRRAVNDPALWVAANERRLQAQKRIELGAASEQDRALTGFTLTRVFVEPELRRRVSLLFLMSLSTVVGSWSVSTWIPQYAAQLANKAGQTPQYWASTAALIFSMGAIAGYLAFGFLADSLGRKLTAWLYYGAALGVSLCLFLWVTGWSALLITAALSGFFVNGQFAWMTIYLPELFPTRVRGSAMSLVFDSSRAIAALGSLMAGWLVYAFGGIGPAAATMALIYIAGLMITPFAGPETRRVPLRT
jgi:MFS family permease